MRVILAALAAACLAGAEAAADETSCDVSVAVDEGLRAALDPIVEAAVAEGFAGQVALLRGGALVYERALGSADAAGAVPVTVHSRFHTASMAKYFTAALTLKAIEEGALRLDQPVAPFFPDAHIAPIITILDLLSHRSGLGSSYAAESETMPLSAAAAIGAAPYDASRAGAFHYSNDGYDLLAIVLERAYGAPYETLLRQKLLAPACLNEVGFWGEADLTDPRAVGQPLDGFPAPLRRRNYGMLGSAGLLISARDLVRWQHALRQGDALSSTSVELMYAPRGTMRLGEAAFGSFLIRHPALGRVISARGAEDWGDNAYLNDYIDCGVTLAIVTSRGPPENSGRPLFRDSISQAIEAVLSRNPPISENGCATPRRP